MLLFGFILQLFSLPGVQTEHVRVCAATAKQAGESWRREVLSYRAEIVHACSSSASFLVPEL